MVEFVIGETYKLMTLEKVKLKYQGDRALKVYHNAIKLHEIRYKNYIFDKNYKAIGLTNYEGMNGFFTDEWHMYSHIIEEQEEIW